MKKISYRHIIESSLQQAKDLLFRSFSIKNWMKLLFIAVMAAQMGGGGGSIKDLVDLVRGKVLEKDVSAEVESAPPSEQVEPSATEEIQTIGKNVRVFWQQYSSQPVFVIGSGVVAVLIIFLVFFLMWLSARFHFVWLHCLLTTEVSIKKPFREYQREGQSLFFFSWVTNIIIFLIFGLGLLWLIFTVWPMMDNHGSVFSLQKILITVVGMLILGLLVLASVLFLFFVNHIIIPIMLIRRSGIRVAWIEFKEILRTHTADILVLVLVFLGLSILTSMAGLIMIVLIGFLGALIAALVGGILYFIFYVFLSVQYMGGIVLVGLGIAWVAVVLTAMALSFLPFIVFLRYVTLNFLSSLDPAYELQMINPKHQTTDKSEFPISE